MTEVEWGELPARAGRGPGKSTKSSRAAEALKARPNVWGRVDVGYAALKDYVKNNGFAEKYEITTRTDDDGVHTWARYLAPEQVEMDVPEPDPVEAPVLVSAEA